MEFLKCRQSLNGALSASTLEGPGRVLKKEKSSECDPQKDEQVKSSPAVKVWSHEGSNLHHKMAQ